MVGDDKETALLVGLAHVCVNMYIWMDGICGALLEKQDCDTTAAGI